MIENTLDDLGADVLPLVTGVDNDIPDRCAVDVIGEDSAETHQSIPIPCRHGHIGMGQHLASIIDAARVSPWRLAILGDQLGDVDVLAVREDNHGLESSNLLVLGYYPIGRVCRYRGEGE